MRPASQVRLTRRLIISFVPARTFWSCSVPFHVILFSFLFSDDVEVPRGVRNAKLTCNEGSVTWYNPIGALRLELSPRIAETFRLCFVLETRNAKIKVSQEKDKALNAKFPPHRSKYILNDSNMVPLLTALGTSKEYCLSSEHPVILYLEPDLSEDLGYQKITFQYDVIKQNDFSEPSIEGNSYIVGCELPHRILSLHILTPF